MIKIKKIILFSVIILGICILHPIFAQHPVERPDMLSNNSFYPGNRAPLQPAAFIKLPLGSIRPEGWIREILERQSDGLCGHLGEISAWLEKEDNAWLSAGGKYGWEEVPYWLRGYHDMALLLGDKEKQKEAFFWVEAILKSQKENGWFGPEMKNKIGNLDFWPNMVILYTLQSYYEHTKDIRVIDFMRKYFQYELTVPDNAFISGYWEKSRGGDNLYSVYWFYNITGEKFVLELAEKLHRCTDNWMMDSTLPNWHNVNIAEGFREPATYYMQSKDSAHLHASYRAFSLIRRTFGQVPGGMFGGDENCRMGYIDPRQGAETCGFAEQMTSDEILIRITGDPFWADNCEDVLFNSFTASLMPDMKSLRYITCPNMVLADDKNHHPGIDNKGPFLMMNPFSSRCCQHNHGHALPYYAQNLIMASNDNGLAAVLYNSCETTARVGNGVEICLKEETNYPFEEGIRFTLSSPEKVSFPLYLRIPGWCQKASLKINGKAVAINATPGSYFRIEREWSNRDQVELVLPMEISTRQWTVNQNSISVDYGPLTFSLIIDEEYIQIDSKKSANRNAKWQTTADPQKWPSWEIRPNSPWNYGLIVDILQPSRSFEIQKRAWPKDNYPFTAESVPIVLKAKGKRIPSWGIDQYGLCSVLPSPGVKTAEKTDNILLIPMGAARLRISSFPQVE